MKPSGGLSRRSELKRVTPLGRGTGGLTRTVPLITRPRADDIPAAVRAQVYARDGWCCVRCGEWVREQPHNLHHRWRRSQGGPHTPENLILLCGTGTIGCHGWVHGHISAARDHGWLLLSGSNPAAHHVDYAIAAGEYAEFWLWADGTRRDRPWKPAGAVQ